MICITAQVLMKHYRKQEKNKCGIFYTMLNSVQVESVGHYHCYAYVLPEGTFTIKIYEQFNIYIY